MALVTLTDQETQIRPSDVYDEDIAATEAAYETNPANLQDNLNHLRSKVKELQGSADWWTALAGRDLGGVETDLADLEAKKLMCKNFLLTDVTVTAAQNWEILTVASSEAPSQVSAVALTQNGAIVAQSALSGAGFNVHELIEVAGGDALHPKNLLRIVDGTTGQPIQSGGLDVYGLLQYESTGVDGAAFNDTSAGNRVKISFVIRNGTGDDLIACPVGDIAGKTINYGYFSRINFDALPEDCSATWDSFVDNVAAVDVTRQNAYTNQGATVVTTVANHTVDLGAGNSWEIGDVASAMAFKVTEGSGGGTTEVAIGAAVDTFNNDAQVNDFDKGLTVNSGGTRPIEAGVTDGLLRTTAGDLEVRGTAELLLNDGNLIGEGTWAGPGVKLTEDAGEVTAYETAFGGEVSLFNAIVQAYNAAAPVVKTCATVTAAAAADVDVGGSGGGANLDAQLNDMSGGTFVSDHDVYLNGKFLWLGADASANKDVYPGTSLALGQLKFEDKVKIGDVICTVSRA
jgi:hypothetical protein